MWTMTRMALALLLFATAAMKVVGSGALLASGGLLRSPIAISLVVALEVFVGVVILTAPRRVGRGLAVVVFSAMTCVAAWAWWHAQDCGCFGAQTPQGVPLLIDLLAISSAVWAGRVDGESSRWTRFLQFDVRAAGILGLALSLLAGGFAAWRIDRQQSDVALPSWYGENLIGSELPLLSRTALVPHVPEVGDVILVLLRPDCAHCQSLASRWQKLRQDVPRWVSVIGVSVSPGRWTVMPDVVSASALDTADSFFLDWEDDEPFVSSPTLLAVRDRVVIGLQSGDPVNEWAGGRGDFPDWFAQTAGGLGKYRVASRDWRID